MLYIVYVLYIFISNSSPIYSYEMFVLLRFLLGFNFLFYKFYTIFIATEFFNQELCQNVKIIFW